MMKRFIIIICVAMIGMAAHSKTLPQNEYQVPSSGYGTKDAPYRISNINQLYWFADQVERNIGGSLCAVLTNDISFTAVQLVDGSGNPNSFDTSVIYEWAGIGTISEPFRGTFDGGGHVIRGLYGAPLFKVIGNGAEIKNLGIENSLIVSNTTSLGSLVGNALADEFTISDCYSRATIKYTGSEASYIGGLVGETRGGSFESCYYIGNIIQQSVVGNTTGGIVAIKAAGDDPTFTRCFSTISPSDNRDMQNSETTITASDLASGRIAWLLNGETGRDVKWYQLIGTEGYPKLSGDASSVVHYNPETDSYTNALIPDFNSNRVLIASEQDLIWFANAINTGKTTNDGKAYDGELVKDITLSNANWSPIGTKEHPFTGYFFGNGHAIKGMKYESFASTDFGLFGIVDGANIDCLGIEDAEVRVGPNTIINVGLLCGKAIHGTTIDHCYARGSIISSTVNTICGGLCGLIDDKATIDRCYSAVTISTANEGAAGVFCGRAIDSQIKACHYLAADGINGVGQSIATTQDCTSHPIEEFQSGAVTYALSPSMRIDSQWGQKLDTEDWPHPYNLYKRQNAVYPTYYCYGPMTDTFTNSSEQSRNTKVHTPFEVGEDSNGFSCRHCEVNPEAPALSDGYYLVANAGNLYWIAQNSNSNTYFRLTADITVNHDLLNADGSLKANPATLRKWQPISGDLGVIDGNKHVIRGIYCVEDNATLVSMTDNASSIINLGIEDSYFAGSASSSSIAYQFNGQITKCYSTATLVAPTVNAPVVLFVTEAEGGPSCIENCWFLGAVLNTNDVSIKNQNSGLRGNNFATLTNTDVQVKGSNTCSIADFQSGSITWQLNGNSVGGEWFQNLEGASPDPLPRFTGNLLVDHDALSGTYFNISMCGGEVRKHQMTHYDEAQLTCLQDGCEDHYACSLCSLLFSDTRGLNQLDPATTLHLRTQPHRSAHLLLPVSDYDCVSGGHFDHYRCEYCGNLYSENVPASDASLILSLDEIIRAAVGHHSLEVIPQVDPTCFKAGIAAHWGCNVCHKEYNDYNATEPFTGKQVRIDALQTSVSVSPTGETTGWESVSEYEIDGDTYTSLYRTTLASEQSLTFVMPPRANAQQLVFIPLYNNSSKAQPFKLIAYVNGVYADDLTITARDASDVYGLANSYFDDLNIHPGDHVKVTLLPLAPATAADCQFLMQFKATTYTHVLTPVKGAYDCLLGGEEDYYQCTKCHYLYTSDEHPWCDDDLRLAPSHRDAGTSHGSLTHHASVPATCGTNGYVEYWTCDRCTAILREDDPAKDTHVEGGLPNLPIIEPTGEHQFNSLGELSTFDHLCTAICDVCGTDDKDHRYIKGAIHVSTGDSEGQNIRLTRVVNPDESYSYHAEPITLNDGSTFFSPVDFTAESLTYSRTFASRIWAPLFLPFDISYSDWSADFDVAELDNVHQYTDEDGDVTRTVLEYVRVTSGTLNAGIPYVIRPKVASAEPQTLTVHSAMVHPTTSVEPLWCASTKCRYNFVGTYDRVPSILGKHYIAGDGLIYYDNSGISLNPLRWYMEILNHDGSPVMLSPQRTVMQLVVLDDDKTDTPTGIEVIEHTADKHTTADGYIYNLAGQRVSSSIAGKTVKGTTGIYINNGKKVIRK